MADRRIQRAGQRGFPRASAGRAATPFGWCVSSGWLCLLVLHLFGCGPALAGSDPEVRVLLYDGTAAIMLGDSKAVQEIRLVGPNELFVPGRGRLHNWVPDGQGPWRVAGRTVRGRIFVRAKQGRIQVLNRVDLEDYVASTVGGEMIASWPQQALRAQAVATRTYVLHEAARRRHSDWDVRATEASQVYLGLEAESKATWSAARATAGQVLTYRGEPILADFNRGLFPHPTMGRRASAHRRRRDPLLPLPNFVSIDELFS